MSFLYKSTIKNIGICKQTCERCSRMAMFLFLQTEGFEFVPRVINILYSWETQVFYNCVSGISWINLIILNLHMCIEKQDTLHWRMWWIITLR